MLDYQARQIVANRMIEDRHAEARRAHLLREVRGDVATTAPTTRVDAGPSLVDRLFAGLATLRSPHVGRPAFR